MNLEAMIVGLAIGIALVYVFWHLVYPLLGSKNKAGSACMKCSKGPKTI